MNRQSYLDAGLLKNECEECIALLKADIADLEYISGNIKTIIGDEGLKSEALDAYKSHLNKYFKLDFFFTARKVSVCGF